MGLAVTGDVVDVGIMTQDVDRALAFYHGTLGLPLGPELTLPDGSRIASVLCGSARLKLYRPEPPPTAAAPGGGHRAATGVRYVTIRVGNAREAYAELDAAGWVLPVGLRESTQRTTFFVQDPEGNNLEIVQDHEWTS